MTTIRLIGITKDVRAASSGESLTVLAGLDLSIDTGESVAVVGRSGSGKSTLLAVLGLLDRASQGTYLLGGQDVTSLTERGRDTVRAETFGFVFQRFCLLPHLTALENVEVALAHRGVRRHRSTRAEQALADVGLASRLHHRPGQLSGGEQQRVALARALSTRPAVVLADEPTGSLDESTAGDVMALIHRAVRSAGSSLVVVTHDPQVAASMGRIVHLRGGRVAGDAAA